MRAKPVRTNFVHMLYTFCPQVVHNLWITCEFRVNAVWKTSRYRQKRST